MNSDGLESLFSRIAPLASYAPDDFEAIPLSGFTNRNIRLVGQGQDWILRMPRPETNRFIDRGAESHNQALAHGLGIAPRPLWIDECGITLTPTLSGCRQMKPRDFTDRQVLEAVLQPLRRLHHSGARFHGRVELGSLLERYYALLLPSREAHFRRRMQLARECLPGIQARDAEPVPSHNDLVLENLLYDGCRVWLIDWEYSAMASPYWDLATLCNSASLDEDQGRNLLRLYCADAGQMEESLLLDYRNLLQLLTDCWMAALVG